MTRILTLTVRSKPSISVVTIDGTLQRPRSANIISRHVLGRGIEMLGAQSKYPAKGVCKSRTSIFWIHKRTCHSICEKPEKPKARFPLAMQLIQQDSKKDMTGNKWLEEKATSNVPERGSVRKKISRMRVYPTSCSLACTHPSLGPVRGVRHLHHHPIHSRLAHPTGGCWR